MTNRLKCSKMRKDSISYTIRTGKGNFRAQRSPKLLVSKDRGKLPLKFPTECPRHNMLTIRFYPIWEIATSKIDIMQFTHNRVALRKGYQHVRLGIHDGFIIITKVFHSSLYNKRIQRRYVTHQRLFRRLTRLHHIAVSHGTSRIDLDIVKSIPTRLTNVISKRDKVGDHMLCTQHSLKDSF